MVLAMLCVGWRLGVDFLVKVGRHETEAQEAFAAVNLPSEKCWEITVAGEPSAWRLDAAYTLSKVAISNSARLRTPPDAGMKPMKLPQNHENENGLAKLISLQGCVDRGGTGRGFFETTT